MLTDRPTRYRRYLHMQDGPLCRLAVNGDNRASDELLARYERWIVQCASKWKIRGYEIEDTRSLGLLGFVRAIRSFDPSKRVKFATFLWFCIRTECQHVYAYTSRQRHGSGLQDDQWDDTVDIPSDALPVEELVISGIEYARLMDALMDDKSKNACRNHEVLRRIADGGTPAEAGEPVGITPQHANRIRELARPRVRHAMETA